MLFIYDFLKLFSLNVTNMRFNSLKIPNSILNLLMPKNYDEVITRNEFLEYWLITKKFLVKFIKNQKTDQIKLSNNYYYNSLPL